MSPKDDGRRWMWQGWPVTPTHPPATRCHLVSQPHGPPEHQDPPEHRRPCAGGGDTKLGTSVGTLRPTLSPLLAA